MPVAGSEFTLKLKILSLTTTEANVPHIKISEFAKLIILKTP
jgi:hypothetical protein